ncbi:protein DsrB [Yersinia intermedia]|uniref:Protein DsrB n=2 Tax=Yersinia intermedia TaxID=631 RepID=A0A208ZPP1_YERIN|nr:DsrB protein [Yersinia sp. FDAARGOS_228]AVL38270.1 DsrB protein [Yersinia intermedia]OVZ73961.1 DsrB protein [Yersinia intermedia]OVZ82451.1 DsrB protein [Yersinia intermedia]QGR68603.1 protein DsrB [Yersinia intermedia]
MRKPYHSHLILYYTSSIDLIEGNIMKVNDRVTVKTDGGPRREGVVLEVEQFSEGIMYLVSLEDYPAGVWFFNEIDSHDGTFVEPLHQ